MPLAALARSSAVSRRLLVIEEGTESFGWGAEVSARVSHELWGRLDRPVERFAARDSILPSAPALEAAVLRTQPELEDAIVELARLMHLLRAPRLNPNDDALDLIEWLREPGAFVRAGEAVCVVETSKAIVEVAAEADGYLMRMAEAGDKVAVGAPLAALTTSPDEEVPAGRAQRARRRGAGARAFTRKAEIAARRLGVDLAALAASLPGDERITEADVEQAARAGVARAQAEQTSGDLVDDVYPDRRARARAGDRRRSRRRAGP